jgi:hypothetical protein
MLEVLTSWLQWLQADISLNCSKVERGWSSPTSRSQATDESHCSRLRAWTISDVRETAVEQSPRSSSLVGAQD